MRLNLPATAVEQALGEQHRAISATETNGPIIHDAATVQETAGNAHAASNRGRALQSTSSGLRALVERFNR